MQFREILQLLQLEWVYDCSCHQSSQYPDCLVVNPPFQNDICESLLTKTLLIKNQDTTLTEQYPLSNVTKYFRHLYTN